MTEHDSTTDDVPTADSPAPRRYRRAIIGGSAAAAVLALGAGGFAVTSAYFTDQENIFGNTVGTATLTVDTASSIPVSVSNLLPDETADPQDFTFKNSGTVDFDYAVSLDAIAPTTSLSDGDFASLLDWLEVTISSDGESDTGTLADLPELTDVGPLAPGATGTVTISIGLSGDANDLAQGQGISFDIVIDATQ